MPLLNTALRRLLKILQKQNQQQCYNKSPDEYQKNDQLQTVWDRDGISNVFVTDSQFETVIWPLEGIWSMVSSLCNSPHRTCDESLVTASTKVFGEVASQRCHFGFGRLPGINKVVTQVTWAITVWNWFTLISESYFTPRNLRSVRYHRSINNKQITIARRGS